MILSYTLQIACLACVKWKNACVGCMRTFSKPIHQSIQSQVECLVACFHPFLYSSRVTSQLLATQLHTNFISYTYWVSVVEKACILIMPRFSELSTKGPYIEMIGSVAKPASHSEIYKPLCTITHDSMTISRQMYRFGCEEDQLHWSCPATTNHMTPKLTHQFK